MEIRENERQRVKANAIKKQHKYYIRSLLTTSKERMNKLRVFELDKYLQHHHLSNE